MKEKTEIGIESAATRLSHTEIALITSEPYRVIIRKLEDLILNPNGIYDMAIENFVAEIAGIDYNLSENKVKGVWYNAVKKIYIAEVRFEGKNKYIASSKKFNLALEAYLNFCKEKDIKP